MEDKLRTFVLLATLIMMVALLVMMYKNYKRSEELDKAILKDINGRDYLKELHEKLPENPS